MSQQALVPGEALVGVALTHLHPGAGRTPGIVDLPVVRDNLGYPLVYASSVKGALKSLCLRRKNAIDVKGTVDCGGKGVVCCCFFGGEPGEGDKGAGAITVLDLIPLAFPAASADKGYVYVTSHTLLSRTVAVLRAMGSECARVFEGILGEARRYRVYSIGDLGESVYVTATPVRIEGRASSGLSKSIEDAKGLKQLLDSIHPLASTMLSRLLVLEDSLALSVVEKALLRVTRVRLERASKTVASGALWTEEYIPQGTIFLTGIVANNYLNGYCRDGSVCSDAESCIEKVNSELNLKEGLSVFVGGKETVGKGLIVFRPLERC